MDSYSGCYHRYDDNDCKSDQGKNHRIIRLFFMTCDIKFMDHCIIAVLF